MREGPTDSFVFYSYWWDLAPLHVVPLAQALLSAGCFWPPRRWLIHHENHPESFCCPNLSYQVQYHTMAPFPHSQPHPQGGSLLQWLQASLEHKTAIAGCLIHGYRQGCKMESWVTSFQAASPDRVEVGTTAEYKWETARASGSFSSVSWGLPPQEETQVCLWNKETCLAFERTQKHTQENDSGQHTLCKD